MKTFYSVIVVASVVAVALASCPNSCSGHGNCSGDDKCACYARKDGSTDEFGKVVKAFTGPDCSLRTCPYAAAWFDLPRMDSDENSAHFNAECSNAGTCDRSSGQCTCFPGYEGRACDRLSCPNSCSGHGTCQHQKQFYADQADENEDAGAINKYTVAWDAKKVYGCKCESGFRGADCSLRECPSGSDPQDGPGATGFKDTTAKTQEFRDCSGRGMCDYSSGLCQCFKGFYGEDCSLQSALV